MPIKIKNIIKSFLITYLLTIILLVILAFIMYKLKLGDNQIKIGVLVIYAVGCMILGFLNGKLSGKKRLIVGVLSGLAYFAILCIYSLIISGGKSSLSAQDILSFIICITAGGIGGILS